ncbi:MAG: class I SAM-dependent methyltransferase [Acidimicrobiales bacterium]
MASEPSRDVAGLRAGAGRRWLDIASDPMDHRVLAHRRANVDAARRPPITDRAGYLCSLAAGKRLLDIGVVDHDLGSDRGGQWLHGRLAAVASFVLGVDVLKPEVDMLLERGFAVECRDVTEGDLPSSGPFDLVVAGEVIEHLDRPGHLFTAAARLLAPDGRFVLTTPNPYAVWRVYQNLRGRPHENVDHVTLVTAWGVAEFAERAGLRLASFRGIRTDPVGRKARLVRSLLRRGWLPVVPEAVCESVLYEVIPAGPGPLTTRPDG